MLDSKLTRVIFIVALFAASSSHEDTSCPDASCLPDASSDGALDDSDMASLLQVRISSEAISPTRAKRGAQDLVFMHMPFNFGNTIEKVAMFPPSVSLEAGMLAMHTLAAAKSWDLVRNSTQPGGAVWVLLNPDLTVTSNVTQCPLFLTPPKYWPEDIAKKYIGNKKVLGVIRDPFERLVAQFRGGVQKSASDTPEGRDSFDRRTGVCNDVNKAVKDLLKKLKASGDMFQGGCNNIPQSEFLEGPYGITVPIDNWRFPKSANEVFEQHGYGWHIRKQDVLHVSGCEDSWSRDLDDETRSLVREVYAKDFDIICKSFGYCNFDEYTCIQGVHTMCPPSVFAWDAEKEMYCPKPGANVTNIRVRKECS